MKKITFEKSHDVKAEAEDLPIKKDALVKRDFIAEQIKIKKG